MSDYRAEATATISAKPAQVYAILADYQNGHQRILPPKYFEKMEVIEGGIGAGTKLAIVMNIFGNKSAFQQTVSEPEPGRILVEANDDGSATTTFLCEPALNGEHTQVTITTVGTVAHGWRGRVENRLIPWILGRIYQQELALLAKVAAQDKT